MNHPGETEMLSTHYQMEYAIDFYSFESMRISIFH